MPSQAALRHVLSRGLAEQLSHGAAHPKTSSYPDGKLHLSAAISAGCQMAPKWSLKGGTWPTNATYSWYTWEAISLSLYKGQAIMQWWWTKLLDIKASWFEKHVSRQGVPKCIQLDGTSSTVQGGFPLQKLYLLMHCNPHTVPASKELRVKWIHYMCLSFFLDNIFSSLIQFQA